MSHNHFAPWLVFSLGLLSACHLAAQTATAEAKARYAHDLKLCADEPQPQARLQCRRDARAAYDQALVAPGRVPGAAQGKAQAGTPTSPQTATSTSNATPTSPQTSPPSSSDSNPPTPATQAGTSTMSSPATQVGASAPSSSAMPSGASPKPPAAAAAGPGCAGCGRVSAVVEQEREGQASAVGAIAGSAAGALLGQQLGAGLGRDLATLAGAVGGAYAGREIEKKVRARRVWVVTVLYDTGQTAQFEFEQEPDFRVGDAVRNSGASVVRN